ncbi:hypothetical protein JNUCC23_02230 [Peribacillus sp. JNUCC 23]
MKIYPHKLEEGLMDYEYGEFEVADHTKFETTATSRICNVKSVNGIITDPMISPSVVKKYEDNDIHLFYSPLNN